MKINLKQKPAGVVLIVALFIIVASGIILASYLTMMQSEAKTVARSQLWNQCVPVMEAGVEEAFAQIHYCNNTTNLSSNSWILGTNGYYQKTRTVGTDGSYCTISISSTTPPVIYSTGYVAIPGTSTNYISRQVRVTTTNEIATGGLISKGAISLTGNARLDSYNSAVAPYNSSAPGTNAIALTDSTNYGAINLTGSSLIYGLAVTGPSGTVTWSGTSAVGSSNWDSTSGGGVQTGWSANDANVQINSNSPPNTSGWFTSAPSSGLLGSLLTTNYTYPFNNANYYISGNLALTGIQTMGVTGNVQIYVTGNFSIANSAYVYIAPNSSLVMYVGGTVSVGGAGVVNANNLASTMTIYGLTTCTSATFANSGAFFGTVNTPNAAVSVTGAGGVYGQITGSSITIQNSGAVHFDQALGLNAGIVAASWNEL